VFETILEAKVVVEGWRREYNHIRPHSSLGYRPPAPEVIIPMRRYSVSLHLTPMHRSPTHEVVQSKGAGHSLHSVFTTNVSIIVCIVVSPPRLSGRGCLID